MPKIKLPKGKTFKMKKMNDPQLEEGLGITSNGEYNPNNSCELSAPNIQKTLNNPKGTFDKINTEFSGDGSRGMPLESDLGLSKEYPQANEGAGQNAPYDSRFGDYEATKNMKGEPVAFSTDQYQGFRDPDSATALPGSSQANVRAGLDPAKDLGIEPGTGVSYKTPLSAVTPKHITNVPDRKELKTDFPKFLKRKKDAGVPLRESTYKKGELSEAEARADFDKDKPSDAKPHRKGRKIRTSEGVESTLRPDRDDYLDQPKLYRKDETTGKIIELSNRERLRHYENTRPSEDGQVRGYEGTLAQQERTWTIAAEKRMKKQLYTKVDGKMVPLRRELSLKKDSPLVETQIELDKAIRNEPPSIKPDMEVQWRKRDSISESDFVAREKSYRELYGSLTAKQKQGVPEWNKLENIKVSKSTPTRDEITIATAMWRDTLGWGGKRTDESKIAEKFLLERLGIPTKRASGKDYSADQIKALLVKNYGPGSDGVRGVRPLQADLMRDRVQKMSDVEFDTTMKNLQDVKDGKVSYGYDWDLWKEKDPQGYADYIERNQNYAKNTEAERLQIEMDVLAAAKVRSKENSALSRAIQKRTLDSHYSKEEIADLNDYINTEGVKYLHHGSRTGSATEPFKRGYRQKFDRVQEAKDRNASRQATADLVEKDLNLLAQGKTPESSYTTSVGRTKLKNERVDSPSKKQGPKSLQDTYTTSESLPPGKVYEEPGYGQPRKLEDRDPTTPGLTPKMETAENAYGRVKLTNKNVGNEVQSMGYEQIDGQMTKGKAQKILDEWDDVIALKPTVAELRNLTKRDNLKLGITDKNIFGKIDESPFVVKSGDTGYGSTSSKYKGKQPYAMGDYPEPTASTSIFSSENRWSGHFRRKFEQDFKAELKKFKNNEAHNLHPVYTKARTTDMMGNPRLEAHQYVSTEMQDYFQKRYIDALKQDAAPSVKRSKAEEARHDLELDWLYHQGIGDSPLFKSDAFDYRDMNKRKNVDFKKWTTKRRAQFKKAVNSLGKDLSWGNKSFTDFEFIAKKATDDEWKGFLEMHVLSIQNTKLRGDASNPFRPKEAAGDTRSTVVEYDSPSGTGKTDSSGEEIMTSGIDSVRTQMVQPSQDLPGEAGRTFRELWDITDTKKVTKEINDPEYIESRAEQYRELAKMLHRYDVPALNKWIATRKKSRIEVENGIFSKGGRLKKNDTIVNEWKDDLRLEAWMKDKMDYGYGPEGEEFPVQVFEDFIDAQSRDLLTKAKNLRNKSLKTTEKKLKEGSLKKEDTKARYLKEQQNLYPDKKLAEKDEFKSNYRRKETLREKNRRKAAEVKLKEYLKKQK